ncbi:MAG TPA: hypothetical protein VK509_06425, partial [Polyangiales bacterium]|nr:hypothetical protein [Polyangiales bacterium]
GCEVDVRTDVANCDSCGTVCSFAHAVASCTAGSCGIASCEAGYGDCDVNTVNGCELLIGGDDRTNCGGCGTVCDAADYCVAGACVDRKPNDALCSAAGECSSGICFTDDKCGSPNGEACTDATTCRGGACSASGVCMSAGGCVVDDDCTSDEFCDTALNECTDKLANGVTLPTIAGHDPELTGACTDDAALAVCVAGVCDAADAKCGFDNDHGSCDGSNAASVCRSGVCGADGRCGYPDGEGSCTGANAALVCRSGVCGALSQMCADEVGCALDADCTSAQLCDTATTECTPKLPNGTPLPTIVGHDPALDGSCTAAAAVAACSSGVCDAGDDKCGVANGNGTCDQTSAATVCRSGVCSDDGKCGYDDGEGDCTSVNAGAVCRSGVCSVSNVCMPTSGCAVDADCTSSQFCNTATAMCTAKLDNGTAIPTIAGHDPALGGTCSSAVGLAVCKAGVCDAGDDRCGYRNDQGSCTSANAGSVCRSGACGSDGKCGFRDGEGTCIGTNAAAVCRSATCDAETRQCGVPAGCSKDADCTDQQFCNNESGDCVAKLDDGVMVPVIDGHVPELSGQCSQAVGAAVCKAGACDERDDRCGYANDGGSCDSSNVSRICRSGRCGSDGACGLLDGEGPCSAQDGDSVCRSGTCSDALCGPALGCGDDGDCADNQFCDIGARECKKKKADGKSCVDDNQCRSDSCNADSKRCNTCVGNKCGELKISGGGCRTSTSGTGDDGSWWLALSAIALAWRARRRARA